MTLDLELVSVFLDEAQDLLCAWERWCLDLQRESTADGLRGLSRTAHSLKGGAAGVGLADFSSFVHSAEHLMSWFTKRQEPPSPSATLLFLECHETMRDWISELLLNPAASRDVTKLTARLEQSLNEEKMRPLPSGVDEIAASSAPSSTTPTGRVASAKPPPAPRFEETIRISAAKLDELVQLLGELSIQQAIVENARRSTSLSTKGHNRLCSLVSGLQR